MNCFKAKIIQVGISQEELAAAAQMKLVKIQKFGGRAGYRNLGQLAASFSWVRHIGGVQRKNVRAEAGPCT